MTSSESGFPQACGNPPLTRRPSSRRGLFGGEAEVTEEGLGGLEALSAGSALLVVKRGPNAGSRFQLDKDVVSAGRHPQSDIFLDDVTVSRRHAEFRRTSEGYEVSDVGSLNGTYVKPRADRILDPVQR